MYQVALFKISNNFFCSNSIKQLYLHLTFNFYIQNNFKEVQNNMFYEKNGIFF